MRQSHKAGEKCFVDYAGKTIPVVDPETGEIRVAYLFVGVQGANSHTCAEAHLDQDLAHWTRARVRMFSHVQGSPQVLADNLKSGVDRPCSCEPDVNPTFLAGRPQGSDRRAAGHP